MRTAKRIAQGGLLVGGLLAALAGCTTSADDGGDDTGPGGKGDGPSQHPQGEPTIDPSPFQWASLSPEDAAYLKSYLMGHSAGEFKWTFGPDNPAAARVQAWVDAYHARVEALFASQFPGHAPPPKPEVMLIADSGVNAWVTHVPVCLDARFELAGADVSDEVPAAVLGPDGLQALYPPVFGPPVICADTDLAPRVAEFVDYFNRTVESACELSLLGKPGAPNPTIRISGCSVDRGTAFGSARSAAFFATAPRVMVTTGMLLAQEGAGGDLARAEIQLASVIAHELAHYYRAHPVHANRYGYFHRQTEEPQPLRPAPVADSPALEAQKDRLFGHIPPIRVPASRYNGRLTAWLARYVPALLFEACGDADDACPAQCEQAADLAYPPGDEAAASFGLSPLSTVMRPEHRDRYRTFETLLESCVHEVALADIADDASGGGVLSRQLMTGTIRMGWLEDGVPSDAATLGAVVDFLDTRAEAFDAEVATFLDLIARDDLGLYGLEQEADQLSAELMAEVGLDPIEAVHKHLATGKRHQAGHTVEDWERFQGLDMAVCESLLDLENLASSWRDDAGDYVFVPMGDLGTPHHGACYRVFDLTRELIAHAYEPTTPPLLSPDPARWQEVLDEAQRQQDRPTPMH